MHLPAHVWKQELGSIKVTYCVLERVAGDGGPQKTRDYLAEFGGIRRGAAYPSTHHGNISTSMPMMMRLAFTLERMLRRLRYARPPNEGFFSVCSCLSGDAMMTPTHSCKTAQQPFHSDLWDGVCRLQPGLLPNSWRKRPVPVDLRQSASASDIPDTDKPPDACLCLCQCGETFSTATRLLLHVQGVHRPGTVHHAGLQTLPRTGGA